MQLEIIKCHGSGNDFLLIDEISFTYEFSEEDRQKLAISLCDRKGELGADGILFVMKSIHCDARMRVFNADGSEASMCGNGLRCVSRYVCELLQKDQLVIETMKANLSVKKEDEIFRNIPTYQVEISPVSFLIKDLPLIDDRETIVNELIPTISNEFLFSVLAVPNPHLVTIVSQEQLDSPSQGEISKRLNGPNHICPDGVNVSFVKPISDANIFVRTYERGVGFTNACGTAMSSSALVTCLLNLNELETKINVFNNGGMVQCIVHRQNDQYSIDLIGNATYMYKYLVDWNPINSQFKGELLLSFDEELRHYDKLQKHVEEILQ